MAELPNQYTLMHKDIPVAGIMVDSASGAVISISIVYEQSHVPVGIPVRDGKMDSVQGDLKEDRAYSAGEE